jgi:GT2 family glycosyltransferase
VPQVSLLRPGRPPIHAVAVLGHSDIAEDSGVNKVLVNVLIGDNPMGNKPLVTIMIATKDRHEDLALTVSDLLRQDYPNLELIVIDDASTPPIAPIVREYLADARIVRHERNCGQNVRRNEGSRLASGKYILSLDDDCSPVNVNAISLSVEYLEATPECAGITYFVWNGRELPAKLDNLAIGPGNCLSHLAGASMFRRDALVETAGYREMFVSGEEEQELSLQLLKRGWRFSYRPEILAHHRCSLRNRNRSSTWKRSLRNSIWTILIHYPLSRIPVEVVWKVTVGVCDAIRLKRGRQFFEALAEAIEGAGTVWKLRDPLDPLSLRRCDALRAYGVLPYGMFERPPAQRWQNFMRCAKRWRNKLRAAT